MCYPASTPRRALLHVPFLKLNSFRKTIIDKKNAARETLYEDLFFIFNIYQSMRMVNIEHLAALEQNSWVS